MNNSSKTKILLSALLFSFLQACGSSNNTPETTDKLPQAKSNDITVDIISDTSWFEINNPNQAFTVKFIFSDPIRDFHPGEATVKNASFRAESVNLSEFNSEFTITVTPNNSEKDIEIYVRAGVGISSNHNENLASPTLTIQAVDTLPPQISFESEFHNYNAIGDAQEIIIEIYSNEAITDLNTDSLIISNATLGSIEEINSNSHQVSITPDGTGENVTLTLPALTVSDLAGIYNASPVSITITPEELRPLIASKAELDISFKTFTFEWQDVPDATYYNILEQINEQDYTALASNIEAGVNSYSKSVSLASKVNAKYILQSCNKIGCTDDRIIYPGNMLNGIGYIKTNQAIPLQLAGNSISLNTDATIMVIGAPGSPYTTTDKTQIRDEWIPGAAYLFRKINGTWIQEQKLQAPEPENNDGFGNSVSLSSDGNTLAIGSYKENSSSLGVNSTANNSKALSGAVYIYNYVDGAWQQDSYIKPATSYVFQLFGTSCRLSPDGNTLVVGAPGAEVNLSGALSNPLEAVYVFKKADGLWYQQDYVTEFSSGENINFGESVEINQDGTRIFVGAPYSDHINSDDTTTKNTGLAFAYELNPDGQWEKSQTFIPINPSRNYALGKSVALSGNGEKLAIGSYSNNDNKGEINLYDFIDNQWSFNTFIQPSNPNAWNTLKFSNDMAFNFNGTLLVVGAPTQRGELQGVNQPIAETGVAISSGAAYVYKLREGLWEESSYLKSANPNNSIYFGASVAVSVDGETIIVGDTADNSALTGILPNLSNTDEETIQATGSVSIF